MKKIVFILGLINCLTSQEVKNEKYVAKKVRKCEYPILLKGIQGTKLFDEVFDIKIKDQVIRGRFLYDTDKNISIANFDETIFLFTNGEVLIIENGSIQRDPCQNNYEKMFSSSVETWCNHVKFHKEESKGNYSRTEFKEGEFHIIFDYQIKPFKLVKVSYITNKLWSSVCFVN